MHIYNLLKEREREKLIFVYNIYKDQNKYKNWRKC